ncbi:MAG: Ig-like domain-containing protein [candidate division WOR-3 bacterium]|jgi:hypothetical protein
MKFKPLLLTLLLLGTGCDLFLSLLDRTPPTCIILFPPDSAIVSGVVLVRVEAYDSSRITAIDFYADGVLTATESSATAEFEWNTTSLEPGSWHRLFCIATDPAGNKGSSDTLNLQIARPGQQNIFHGKFTLNNNYYRWIDFSAGAGKRLAGESRAVNGIISRLSLLDADNFQQYRQHQSYSALYEQQNAAEMTLSYQFTTAGTYYLVFLNTTGTPQTYWARFTLE